MLEKAVRSFDKLVGVTVVLAEEDDFPGMNEDRLKWLPPIYPLAKSIFEKASGRR